ERKRVVVRAIPCVNGEVRQRDGLVAGINDVPDEMGGADRSSSIMIRTDRGGRSSRGTSIAYAPSAAREMKVNVCVIARRSIVNRVPHGGRNCSLSPD